MAVSFGFARISLLTRLNSRAKLNFMQLLRQALVDTYVKLVGDDLSPEQMMNMQAIQYADNKRLRYIIKGDINDLLVWYYLINPLKIPEFILTFVVYALDRLCLIGLKELPGSDLRGQRMSWPRFLLRGLIQVTFALPLFFARCIGSPINTVALPCTVFFARVFNYDPHHQDKDEELSFGEILKHTLIGELIGWMWLIPYLELYAVLSTMIPALIAGVPLMSMGMVAAVFGGTGAALIATTLTLALLPIALPFVLTIAGNQPRPSDALYREVDLSHKGDDETAVSSYKELMQQIKSANPEKYSDFCANKEDLDCVVDEALDNVPRRFEFVKRAKDPLIEHMMNERYRVLSRSYHTDKGGIEGAQTVLNAERDLYNKFTNRFIADTSSPSSGGSPTRNTTGVD